jgi:NSS family neurotransmitter:Na+ symporter
VTANLMMPVTGLLLALFVGWRIRPEAIEEQLQIRNRTVFRAWFWLLRWVVPISIAAVLISIL